MRWVKTAKDGETGATLIVVTLATLVLFGFAALAVDVGNGMAERRRAQTTVDASVMAAAVEAIQDSTLHDVVEQGRLFANNNAPAGISDTAWLDDCPDSENPDDQLDITASDLHQLDPSDPDFVGLDTECISFSITFDEIRVSLPQQIVETYFAGVIGIDTFDVTAFAHASIHSPGIGNPPPFVVANGTTGGQQICLRVKTAGATLPPQWVGNGPDDGAEENPPTPTGEADPCSDGFYLSLSQLRGTLNPYVYESCTQPGSSAMASIIANGIDHPLGTDWLTEGDKVDGDGCKDLPQRNPNTMDMQTGTTSQILMQGLLVGGTYDKEDFTGRLQQGDFFSEANWTFAGEPMDNEPLWAFIDHAQISTIVENKGAPDACGEVSLAYTSGDKDYDYYDLKDRMLTCIEGWSEVDNPMPIFNSDGDDGEPDIEDSSRFTFLPQSSTNQLDGTVVHFVNWIPVWFQKLYQEGTGNPESDPCFSQDPSDTGNKGWYMHEAGQQFHCGKPNQNIDALSSIVIECGMLPATLCDPTTSPGGNPGGTPVWTVELTR